MSSNAEVTVREVSSADEARWKELYHQYRDFYRLERSEDAVMTTWLWVSERQHGLSGLVALVDGQIVGLANIRRFARPSSARLGIYLDDLFTDAAIRRTGAASALLAEIASIAAGENANVVRWITATDNATARSLYDSLATATPWVTYDMPPAC